MDQKITNLVSEQQKLEAQGGHVKSELEQLKQDIANVSKQKQSLSKALENKVSSPRIHLTTFHRRGNIVHAKHARCIICSSQQALH